LRVAGVSNGNTEYMVANWFCGHETEAEYVAAIESFTEAFQIKANEARVDLGPAEWRVVRPGDEGCPEVPGWVVKVLNERGRHMLQFNFTDREPIHAEAPALLVCVRKVTKRHGNFETRTFLADLTQDDHAKLRAVTKRQWLLYTGGEGPLTDSEADVFLEQIGPEAARNLIMKQTVH
jgi:hypothetical protein